MCSFIQPISCFQPRAKFQMFVLRANSERVLTSLRPSFWCVQGLPVHGEVLVSGHGEKQVRPQKSLFVCVRFRRTCMIFLDALGENVLGVNYSWSSSVAARRKVRCARERLHLRPAWDGVRRAVDERRDTFRLYLGSSAAPHHPA